MRRVGIWLLALALLAGCGGPAAPVEKETPAETRQAMEELHASAVMAAEAGAVYAAITADLTFTVSVEAPDAAVTALSITPDNAWNVAGRENLFDSDYDWSAAGAGDWDELCAAGDRGRRVTITDGAAVLESCAGGDVVHWVRDGRDGYARAVNPREGREPYEHKFCWQLEGIAEDALRDAMFSGLAVDGAETDCGTVAALLAEQAAAYVRGLPDWVSWKPADIRAGGTGVFDAYRGEPENFCCNMGFRLLLESRGLDGLPRNAWEAGAGLSDPDEDGYYDWGREVLVQRNGAGDWVCAEWGTGGSSVSLPCGRWDTASLEDLVDAFFLTEGNTHDWLLPSELLERSPEELAALPALLSGRSQAECRDLGAALMGCYRLYDNAADGDRSPGAARPEEWVPQADLRAALGAYAVYLDA